MKLSSLLRYCMLLYGAIMTYVYDETHRSYPCNFIPIPFPYIYVYIYIYIYILTIPHDKPSVCPSINTFGVLTRRFRVLAS